VFFSHYNGHGIKLVRPLSTVDNTRDYARVSHSRVRRWSNYITYLTACAISLHQKIWNPPPTLSLYLDVIIKTHCFQSA